MKNLGQLHVSEAGCVSTLEAGGESGSDVSVVGRPQGDEPGSRARVQPQRLMSKALLSDVLNCTVEKVDVFY